MSRARRAPAVIGINFYPVGAMTNLIADDARQAVKVGFFGALRHAPLRCIAFGTIASCCHDGPRYDKHAGTGNDPLLHRLFETDIGVTRAFGAQVSDSRKTR